MKRAFVITLAAVAAAALFGVLVYAVLAVAHLSEPGATTVYGLTSRRLWATTAVVLALIAVVIGGMATYRRVRRIGNLGRRGAIVALITGLVAAVSGALNLAIANSGPGTGNGVVGGAAAFVLGLVAVGLGGTTLARSRRISLQPERMT